MKKEKMSRKERRKREDRQLIIDTATRLFATRGYHQVTMNEIARESEFAVGTLYNFFQTKEEMYESIFLDMARNVMRETLGIFSPEEDVITILRKYIHTVSDYVIKNQSLARLYFKDVHLQAEKPWIDFNDEILQMKEVLSAKLMLVCERGIQEKLFRQLDPREMQLAFNGIFESFMLARISISDDYSIRFENVIDLFLKGVSEN